MVLWGRLKKLFSDQADNDGGIYFYVRCDRCSDQVRVRINPASELRQEFDESGEAVRGYSVRKMVVDQRCFRPIEVNVRFDSSRRELSREIHGGTFLTREEYEAGQSDA
jgi:hypothetical protein